MKTRQIPKWLVISAALLLITLCACDKKKTPAEPAEPAAPEPAQTQGVTDGEILIGVWSPQTGPASSWGAVALGTKAYFDWINEQGGIHGRRLKLVIRDDGYSPPRTVAVVKELVERKKVFCFVGSVGTATGMAVKDYLDERQIVNIGLASGSSSWADPMSRYRFAVYPSYQIESRLLVKYTVQDLKKTKIAMLYQNDAFGKEGLEGAKAACQEFGAEMVAETSYELSDTDLSSQAMNLKNSGAEVVILWATAKHSAIFVKEAARLGFSPQFLATSTLSDPLMYQLAGESWEGTIIANWMPMITDDTPSVKHYQEAIEKYAPEQRLGNFTLAGFILAEPLVEGLRRAGRNLNTDSLIAALESFDHFSGEYIHDLVCTPDNHQGLTSIYFIQAKEGKLVRISDWIQ